MKATQTLAQSSDRAMPWEQSHRQLSYQAALESIVLLENDGTLPLTPGNIALFGAGAEYTCKGGSGSGEVNERRSVSIREGLEQAGFTVTTDGWLTQYRARYEGAWQDYVAAFRKKLYRLKLSQLANIMHDAFSAPVGQSISAEDIKNARTDTCIYVVTRQAGEGSDRRLEKDFRLTSEEKEQIALCTEKFAKTVLVLNVGGVFDLGFLEEIKGINAVIFFAQQGGMGGPALASLLAGRACFSGRLTDTWPRKYEDIPFAMDYSYLNGDTQQEFYREGIYVGYRYFDSFSVAPRYPFGYGLSYTEFSMDLVKLERAGERVTVTLSVTNIGQRKGPQVAQLYAACPQSAALPKEAKRLVAFGKTEVLSPGETQILELAFFPSDLASYRETDQTTVLEQGDYVLMLGEDTRGVAAVRLLQEQVLERHRALCRPCQSVTEISPPAVAAAEFEGPVLMLGQLPCVEHSYQEQPAPDVPLTERQMAALCVGGGMLGWRETDAPGAAGVTTAKLVKLGIPQRVLADGPAGLRLQKETVRLKNGRLKPVEPAMEVMRCLPDFVKRFLCADPKQGRVLYQFATAFPAGMAMAQTWNTALLQELGRAVGREMEAYGVHFWLAPALNLHRNPLCGRNYEYYSEDPLLTGKVAAAVTRGVQSVPGRFVTLKHFACNNQEEDRNQTNANVKQRALRELYLKGFEIAVKEARPGAVMSSYNRLNGIYTANSHGLLTGILRCEWGFDGVVMTDWMGLADDGDGIAAGNDLIMPGSFSNVNAILRALRKGRITRAQLARCAGKVLSAIQKCDANK